MGTKERIFELADAKFKEQKLFAESLGLAPNKISLWRTGKSNSFMKYLPQLADVLGTTTEYLLTGEKKPPATDSGSGELDPLSKAFLDVGIDVQKLSEADRALIVRVAKAALDL